MGGGDAKSSPSAILASDRLPSAGFSCRVVPPRLGASGERAAPPGQGFSSFSLEAFRGFEALLQAQQLEELERRGGPRGVSDQEKDCSGCGLRTSSPGYRPFEAASAQSFSSAARSEGPRSDFRFRPEPGFFFLSLLSSGRESVSALRSGRSGRKGMRFHEDLESRAEASSPRAPFGACCRQRLRSVQKLPLRNSSPRARSCEHCRHRSRLH